MSTALDNKVFVSGTVTISGGTITGNIISLNIPENKDNEIKIEKDNREESNNN